MPSDVDGVIETLDALVPIARAIPVLGVPVDSSLEAAKKILEYTQVWMALFLTYNMH
jgi:hypothetical protein